MNSANLFTRAQKVIPGGVNSPVRAYQGVGGQPPFIKKGQGAYIYDQEDKAYIDYVCSWGPLILGHAHPEVINQVQQTAANGLSFGAPTAIEIELAEKICQLVPSIDMVRMVNSGTEATMSAIRLARGFTGRDKIIKFAGCYHGHADGLLVKAGSGLLTLGIPSSPGVPEEYAKHTLTANYNNLSEVQQLFERYANDIAAVIIEPVACNMNCVLPVDNFLQGLRKLCDQYSSVLIFDEIITGFRLGLAGAQGHYNVTPDLTTFGKVIGGGMPVGAFGGQRAIMEHMAPVGPVYQAGTLSGNPVAISAGLTTLELLTTPGIYERIESRTKDLVNGLLERAKANDIPLVINTIASIFGMFFTDADTVTNFNDVSHANIERFKQFFHGMLKHGIYLAPSAFEVGFVSSAHSHTDIDKTLAAAEQVFEEMR